jgi:gamma-glutamylcyclotransferase
MFSEKLCQILGFLNVYKIYMRFYFAYGSNMNPERLKSRGVEFLNFKPAILRDYKLTFNKISGEGYGYANIEPHTGGKVEGILYELKNPEEAIYNLDWYEGYPYHYDRIILPVETDNGIVKAITYIATPQMLGKNLRPTHEYLSNLLVPCKMALLSEEYCRELKKWLSKKA